jgi:hypothetical protein
VKSFVIRLTGHLEPVPNLVAPDGGRSFVAALAVYFTVVETLVLQQLLKGASEIVCPKRIRHPDTQKN